MYQREPLSRFANILSPLPSTEGRGETWIFRGARTLVATHVIIVINISILAIAAFRLDLSDQPYVDRWSWRQSDVAAIARIFCKTDVVSAIRKLIGGNAPVYVGTEFPILPFIAAICYKLAGDEIYCANLGCHFVRGVGAIFFPACPGDFRQHGGRLGNFLL